MAHLTYGEKEAEIRIHESNPFKERYSCDCGSIVGEENLGQGCDKCHVAVRLRPAIWRNYKGWVNQPRLRGPRQLNSKEQAFKEQVLDAVHWNSIIRAELEESEFINKNFDDIITQIIGNCKYLNRRINWPKDFDTDITDTMSAVFQYTDYIIQEVYYPPEGEKARDSLWYPDIDTYVQDISNLISGLLVQHLANNR